MQACIKTAIQTSAYIKSCKSVECFCGILLCAFVINKNAPKDVFVLCVYVMSQSILFRSNSALGFCCQRSRQLFRTIVKTNGSGGLSGSMVSRFFHSSAYTSCTQSRASSRLRSRLYASAYIFPLNGKYICVNCSRVMSNTYFEPLKIPLSVSSLSIRFQPSLCLVPKSRLTLKLSISTWR